MKKRAKSIEVLNLCKRCKNSDPIMSEMLSSDTEDQISDLLQRADIVKVFKCLTRIKKQKYKNLDQYALLLHSLFKKDFTQTLIENIHDTSLVSELLSYPTQIQWRKMYNNQNVLEFFILNISDLTVVDLLRKKITNILDNLPPSTSIKEPPPYSSLKFQEDFGPQKVQVPSAPLTPTGLTPKALETLPYCFPGKWLLLYNGN